MKLLYCFCFLLLTVCLPAPRAQEQFRLEDSRVAMACTYNIAVYGADAGKLPTAVNAALDEVKRIDRLMSHYKPDSPLSRLNREAAKQAVKVEPELFNFIAECLRYSRLSDGAFDITVGPLLKAWGFFGGEGRLPSERELNAARGKVGYQHVILNDAEKTIRFAKEGVELDLGGIAKGYAVDRAVAILKQHGVASALVSAGGSTIYGLGSPPGEKGWEVKVQSPTDKTKEAMAVRLRNRALSISGSTEKFFEHKGQRYSHVLDPRTGQPVQGVLNVIVLADNGTAGDALDNVFYVLGIEKSRDYIGRFTVGDVLFFFPDPVTKWKAARVLRTG